MAPAPLVSSFLTAHQHIIGHSVPCSNDAHWFDDGSSVCHSYTNSYAKFSYPLHSEMTGHNGHGPKMVEGLCPFFGEGAGSPFNTISMGLKPTCMPGFILICPTIWPQYTNVTDRTDYGPIAYGERFTNGRPKTTWVVSSNKLARCDDASPKVLEKKNMRL